LIYSARLWCLFILLGVIAFALHAFHALPPWLYEVNWGIFLLSLLVFGLLSYVLSPGAELAYVVDLGRLEQGIIDLPVFFKSEIEKLRSQQGISRVFSTLRGDVVLVANDVVAGLPKASKVHSIGLLEFLGDVEIIRKTAPEVQKMALQVLELSKYSGLELGLVVRKAVELIVQDLKPEASVIERAKLLGDLENELERISRSRAAVVAGPEVLQSSDGAAGQSDAGQSSP
jgi:hypothetical protein